MNPRFFAVVAALLLATFVGLRSCSKRSLELADEEPERPAWAGSAGAPSLRRGSGSAGGGGFEDFGDSPSRRSFASAIEEAKSRVRPGSEGRVEVLPEEPEESTRTDERLRPGEAADRRPDEPWAPVGMPEGQAPAVSLKLDRSVSEGNIVVPLAEHGIQYDPTGAYFGADARLALPTGDDIPSDAGTVIFWMAPDWEREEDTNASLFQWRTNEFANRVQIFKNGRYLRFLLCDNTGFESGVGTHILHWPSGSWHSVAATWGNGVAAFYLDGSEVGARSYAGEILIPPGTPWYVGSDLPGGGPGARSRLNNFQVFPRFLGADEIANILAQTRPAE